MRKLLLATVAVLGLAASAHAQEGLMTRGEKGDYFQSFPPPLIRVLAAAWVDAQRRTSAGTPENLDYVLEHQTAFALAQGNVYAELQKDAKYKDKFKILPATIGN